MEKVDKYIPVANAAKKLRVSEATIYRMIADGRLGGKKMACGLGSRYSKYEISVESIELLETNSKILSVYQEKKMEQLKLI